MCDATQLNSCWVLREDSAEQSGGKCGLLEKEAQQRGRQATLEKQEGGQAGRESRHRISRNAP